jgi:hypothetical protein
MYFKPIATFEEMFNCRIIILSTTDEMTSFSSLSAFAGKLTMGI